MFRYDYSEEKKGYEFNIIIHVYVIHHVSTSFLPMDWVSYINLYQLPVCPTIN